jgi:hypothetical protein
MSDLTGDDITRALRWAREWAKGGRYHPLFHAARVVLYLHDRLESAERRVAHWKQAGRSAIATGDLLKVDLDAAQARIVTLTAALREAQIQLEYLDDVTGPRQSTANVRAQIDAVIRGWPIRKPES